MEEVIVGVAVEIAVVHRVVEIVGLQERVPVLTERRDHLDLVCSSWCVWKRNNLLFKKNGVHLTLDVLIQSSFAYLQVHQLKQMRAPHLDAAPAGENAKRSEHR